MISESHSERCFRIEAITERRPHLRGFLFALADYALGLEESADRLTGDALAWKSDRLLMIAGRFRERAAIADSFLDVLD